MDPTDSSNKEVVTFEHHNYNTYKTDEVLRTFQYFFRRI